MAKNRFIPAAAALSKKVAECLKFVKFTNEFRRQPRLIWYKGNDERELTGDHSYQLMMFAWFIRDRHLPHLNREKVILYAGVHDTPEIYAIDTPAFPDPTGTFAIPRKINSKTKDERERKATLRLEREWSGSFPAMIKYLKDYQAQADEESRFVYALDKFLAELNIYEDDSRTDKRLGVSREAKEAYKRPRIATHPFLSDLYDDFCRFCRIRDEIMFDPRIKTDATT